MKIKLALLALFIGLAWGAVSGGAPVTPVEPRYRETIEPFGQKNYLETFQANERSCVIVVGNGLSYLGLYIYDSSGNCIAWDDGDSPESKDSLAAEWIPAQKAPFAIQVRNLSGAFNQYKIAIR